MNNQPHCGSHDTVPGRRLDQIKSRSLDFQNLYVELTSLVEFIRKNPSSIDVPVIESLFELLLSDRHIRQKQAFFLYQAAGDALIFCAVQAQNKTGIPIIKRLQKIVLESKERKQRAVSGALGTLPIKVQGPVIASRPDTKPCPILFEDLFSLFDQIVPADFRWHGRTLRFECRDHSIVCVKFARNRQDIDALYLESVWMRYFNTALMDPTLRFHVPEPFERDGCPVFRIQKMPVSFRQGAEHTLDTHAIVFRTQKSYYVYPNETASGLDPVRLFNSLTLNASLAGALAGRGVVHTALIPLFHNRVQQRRRQDQGRYLWEHGGRLDRWLESCRYPNMSVSGLRDFEHFASLPDSGQVSHFIGEHLLAFILTIGSCFRNQEPDNIGFDRTGRIFDQRHLFEHSVFESLVCAMINAYCINFTGSPFDYAQSVCTPDLIDLLINAMGVDTDMEERLRIQDQISMSQDEFTAFLTTRGIEPDRAARMVKGKEEITFNSGPHLGGFNQPISIPELTGMLFCVSALCVSERYLSENGLKGPVN